MFTFSKLVLDASILEEQLGATYQTKRKLDPDKLVQKADKSTGEIRLVDGLPVYSVPVRYGDMDGDDDTMTIYVHNKPEDVIPYRSIVRLTGRIRISQWTDDNGWPHFVTTADGLEVVSTPQAPTIAPRGAHAQGVLDD